jgi:Ca2+-binding RTX toxin-like protein
MNTMQLKISRVLARTALGCFAALVAPCSYAQTTTPTCNGLPATIVATVPGQIVGTNGDDVIVGTPGVDRIFGLAGNDTICGLGGNDQITGGFGNDALFGQEGNDTFMWNPGDGSDRIEGGSESDILMFNGANTAESIDLSAIDTRIRLTRNVGVIALDIAGVERIDIEAAGGSDLIAVASVVGTGLQHVTIDLEGVRDSNTPDLQPDSVIVFGSKGDDKIGVVSSANTLTITGAGPSIQVRNPEAALDVVSVYGDDGNDQIDAQRLAAGLTKLIVEGNRGHDLLIGSAGADTLVGGEGNDTFLWTLGTPADGVLGEAGVDKLQVVGSNGADNVAISVTALETYVQNVVDKALLTTDVEEIVLQVKSGADQVFVGTAAAASLQKVSIDLRPSTTVLTGDGYSDSITINGTSAADTMSVSGAAGSLTVSGLAPAIAIQGSDYARDTLTVNAVHEADTVNAQGLSADAIRVVVKGGPGNDTLIGSLGNDVFVWNPGDGSDTLDGRAGTDTLQFFGANIGENIGLTADQTHLRFARDIGTITIDAVNLEQVKYAALGGADTISLGDLSATAVRQVAIDLGASNSPAGDLQADTISINALTTDAIATTTGPGMMNVRWKGVTTTVTGVEPVIDKLTVQTPVAAPATLTSSVRADNNAEVSQ